MSIFTKNRQGLTARQYAQKLDRFKFHRVVKLLRELEQREQNTAVIKEKIAEDVIEENIERQQGLAFALVQNRPLSFALSLLIGLVFFIFDVMVYRRNESSSLN